MYRKKLFLESVHKLGLGPEKENVVVSLFEATIDPNDNDELDMLDDENPSDKMDYLSGEVEDKPEGSALEEQSEEVDENKLAIERFIQKLDNELSHYIHPSVSQRSLPSTPHGRQWMYELEARLREYSLGAVYRNLTQAMQMMQWEVIQFNKADSPSEAWKLQFNPGAANTKKYNAITMIRQYMFTIILNLVIIMKKIGLTEPLNIMNRLNQADQHRINEMAAQYLLTNRF